MTPNELHTVTKTTKIFLNKYETKYKYYKMKNLMSNLKNNQMLLWLLNITNIFELEY